MIKNSGGGWELKKQQQKKKKTLAWKEVKIHKYQILFCRIITIIKLEKKLWFLYLSKIAPKKEFF